MKRGSGQRRRNSSKRTLSLTRPLKPMLTQLSLFSSQSHKSLTTPNIPHTNDPINDNNKSDCSGLSNPPLAAANDVVSCASRDFDFILSQDFFCTPDYITPECRDVFNNMEGNKENISCPPSPEKFKSTISRRYKQDGTFVKSPDSLSCSPMVVELSRDTSRTDELETEKSLIVTTLGKGPSYVTQSAVALRCRVMPPPCVRNPYLKDTSEMDVDPFGSWRTKCSGYFSISAGPGSMSRYQTDFQEIEQIGNGNFSRVFKVLNRIDGCLYAIKHSIKRLHHDTERRKALMEVQALAALGLHENVVAYHTSWFENEQLYIQMELCDYSLSARNNSCLLTEEEALEALHQIARALKFIHARGIAHLDVKPDNIYIKNGVYKLGDFGCATLLDTSLPIDEGDARYMPQEILNEKYDHLDKVDIYSLGVSIYELLPGSSLPDTGHQLLKKGKVPLLPNISLQLQNLLKEMVNPDPSLRPSAKQLVQNPVFYRSF